MDREQVTRQSWNEVADAYRKHFIDLDLYNKTYERFLSELSDEASTLLEIGCGPGNITRYLLNKRPALLIDALDYSENMVDIAKTVCPEANIMQMDARHLLKLQSKYNGIVSGFCIPYLNPEEVGDHISMVTDLLLNDGVFYLSFIEGSQSSSGFETGSTGNTMYVHQYEEPYILDLMKKSGLETILSEQIIMHRAGRDDSRQRIIIAGKRNG